MMPSREQLINALRQADQAGDTQAAQRFAELIKTAAPNTVAPQPQAPVAATNQDIAGVPEFGTIDGLDALFGDEGAIGGVFGDSNTGVGQLIRDAGAQLFTLDPRARIDGIKKRFPELELEMIGEDNAIIRNPRNGAINVINAQGLSNQDIAPFLGAAAAASPTAKAMQLPTTIAGKMAAGAAGATATDLAIQGAEQIQGSEQDIDIQRATISGVTGGVMPGVPAAARVIAEKTGANKLLKNAIPTTEALKSRASDIYKELDNIGVKLPKGFANRTLNNLVKKINSEVLPESRPKAIRDIIKSLDNRTGNKISLSEFDAIRKTAASLAKSTDANERRLASIVTDSLDDMFEGASSKIKAKGGTVADKFKQARLLWRSAKKAEIIDDALRNADINGGSINNIQSQFKSILRNKRARRNFSPAEQAAMQRAARSGKVEAMLKTLGAFGFNEGSSLRTVLGSGVGAGLGGATGAIAVPLTGELSKRLALMMTRNKARMAEQVIRAGSDAGDIAKAYIRSVPRSQRRAEDLAEILMLRRANIETNIAKLPTSNHQLLEDALIIASGKNIAAASTSEDSEQ